MVTEGELTEPTYLDGVRRHYRRPKELWRIEPGGGHPQAIVDRTEELQDEARRIGDKFNQVWWVFDIEDPTPHPGITEIIGRAERLGYRCAISHPCFEVWLLLHFQSQTAPISTSAAEHLVRGCDCSYADKGFSFDKIWPHRPKALANAATLNQRQLTDYPRVLDRNPWTSVHDLVNELIRLGESEK
jgi:hypothetical protein